MGIGSPDLREPVSDRFLCGAVLLLFFTGVLVHTRGIPQFIGYVAVGAVSVGLATIAVVRTSSVQMPVYAPLALLTIWSIYVYHLARSPDAASIQRVLAFLTVTSILVLILPRWLSVRSFLNALSLFGASLTVIALPTMAGIEIGPLKAWHAQMPLFYITGPPVPVIMSVLRNPNTLGIVAVGGVAGSIANYLHTKARWELAILVINAIGVYFAGSTSSMLATVAVVGSIGLFWWRGPTGVRLALLGGSFALLTMLLMVVNVLPDFGFFSGSLSGRGTLWPAAWQAFIHQPMGYGATNTADLLDPFLPLGRMAQGPHNAFLRLAITGGVVGLLAYLYVLYATAWYAIGLSETTDEVVLAALVIGYIVSNFFGGGSILGLSLDSLHQALALGVAISVIGQKRRTSQLSERGAA